MKRKTNQPLMHELLLLEDDFAEHACISAFLLASLPAVMSSDNTQQPQVIEGAKLCAERLQARTRELKQQLNHACDRYRAEQSQAD
jgi:hypothetical protein